MSILKWIGKAKTFITGKRGAITMQPREKDATMELVKTISTTVESINVTETTQNSTEFFSSTTVTEAPTTVSVVASSTNAPYTNDNDPLLIGGTIIGVAALVIAFVLLVRCYCRRRKRVKKVPPELPPPSVFISEGTTEPSVAFHPATTRESSTSAHVQIVGYKPLSGAALLPPRKLSTPIQGSKKLKDSEAARSGRSKSVSTSLLESKSVYNNDEVIQASNAFKAPATIVEASNDEQSRDSLYVRPGSWLSSSLSDQHESEETAEEGSVSRSRLDSQKYLLPAELVLQVHNDVRKLSGGSFNGDVGSQSPSGSSFQLKWKVQTPIIHAADEPNRISSVYICMDSGIQLNSPLRSSNSTAGSGSDGCSSPRSLPTPCRKTSNRSSYINLRQDSRTSNQSLPYSHATGLYEPVTSLVLPSVYGNAEEILKSQQSSPEAESDRNDPDTYRICLFPEKPKPLEIIDISEKDLNSKDGAHSDKEALISDQASHDEPVSNHNSGRESTGLSYVNVAQFQKQMSKSEEGLVQTQENRQQPEFSTNDKISEDKANFKPDGKKGKEKNYNQAKHPPKSKKPTTLPKPKNLIKKMKGSDSFAGSPAGLQRAARPSLLEKAKMRMSRNSSSAPDLPSEKKGDLSTDPPSKKQNKKQFPSQAETLTASQGDRENPTVETVEYQNLLPSSMAQNVEVKDNVGDNELNSGGLTQPVEHKVKANKPIKKNKSDIAGKKQNRKSNSLLQRKLELSEIRSKLKKSTLDLKHGSAN